MAHQPHLFFQSNSYNQEKSSQFQHSITEMDSSNAYGEIAETLSPMYHSLYVEKLDDASVRRLRKDLTVWIPSMKGGIQTVLQGLKGCITSGTLMAVKGPSGSSKSTMLDALVGQLPENADVSGSVLLNGRGVFMLVSGCFRIPNDILKPLWRYPLSNISFQFWALQGQYKNDFEGTDFKNQAHFPWASGDHVLSNVFEINVEQSKWWDLSVLFLMSIIHCLLFFIVIKIHQGSVHQIRESISKCWLQRVPKKIQQA